jgi:DNA-binding LacI/PurR family transcriptional regulator
LTPYVANVLNLQYYATLIGAIVEEATNFGLTVTLFNPRAVRKELPEQMVFTDRRCDGLIVVGAPNVDFVPALSKAVLPRVAVNAGEMPLGMASMDIDNRRAGYTAAEFLIRQGHRRIGFVHAGTDEAFSDHRCDGYRAAMRDAGIPVDESLIWRVYNNVAAAHEVAGHILADRESGMTAIFCATDLLALGVIQRLRDAGVRIPAELSVIGIDGLLDGTVSFPKLTTIDQQLANLGEAAVRKLVEMIDQPDLPPTHTVWPTELIIRDSVAAPAMTGTDTQ